METSDLLKKVRKIEIKTRSLSNDIFSGQYHSAFKGRGMAFSEVREYQPGDDIRSIDWNVTARFNHPYVKIFDEERELTVMLLIDVSGSNEFGTQTMLKEELMTEMSAVLAFAAINNNDKVGVIFFSDKIEKFIPPKKGKTHILRIIRELIDFKPESRQTNISEALRYLTNALKKKAIAFVLSDFVDSQSYADALKIANKKHDVVAIKIHDPREENIPNVGLFKIKDAETGQLKWIDSSNKNIRQQYQQWWTSHNAKTIDTFRKSGVDFISIATNQDYIKPLTKLFKIRGGRF